MIRRVPTSVFTGNSGLGNQQCGDFRKIRFHSEWKYCYRSSVGRCGTNRSGSGGCSGAFGALVEVVAVIRVLVAACDSMR